MQDGGIAGFGAAAGDFVFVGEEGFGGGALEEEEGWGGGGVEDEGAGCEVGVGGVGGDEGGEGGGEGGEGGGDVDVD